MADPKVVAPDPEVVAQVFLAGVPWSGIGSRVNRFVIGHVGFHVTFPLNVLRTVKSLF